MAYPGIHKRGRGGILLYNTCVVGAKPPAVCEKPVRAFHCNGSRGLFAGRRQIYQQHRPFETYLCFYLGPPKERGVPDSIIRCVYFGTSHGGTERGTRPQPFSSFFFRWMIIHSITKAYIKTACIHSVTLFFVHHYLWLNRSIMFLSP